MCDYAFTNFWNDDVDEITQYIVADDVPRDLALTESEYKYVKWSDKRSYRGPQLKSLSSEYDYVVFNLNEEEKNNIREIINDYKEKN